MSIATRVLETLFANRYNFMAPDSGKHKLPYTCSFHWFHTPDGQLIGVDVVRSDDMGRRALRVFARRQGGELLSLVLESDASQWTPFATDQVPVMPQGKPVLGRGENWLAASATAPGQTISEVSFLLRFKVLLPGKGTGEAGLLVANMNAMDYLRMEISGWISMNGRRAELDRVIGYASVHFGDFLPDYAGVASVPPENSAGAGILVNVTNSDDIRHGASLLQGRSIVYGYGSGPIPRLFVTAGQLSRREIPLGGARLELSNLKSNLHVLLARPTTTAVGSAAHITENGTRTEISEVILDFRGVEYSSLIS